MLLVGIGRRFWFEHVVPRIAPEPDGLESSTATLRAMPRELDARDASSVEEDAVSAWMRATESRKAFERAEEAARQAVLLAMGGHEVLRCREAIVTLSQNKSGSVDWKAVAMALAAPKGLVEQHTRPGARVLRVKKVMMEE